MNALTVKTTSATPAVVCPNRDPIVVSFSTNGTPPSGTTYTVLISDASGNFQPPTAGILGNIIGTGSSSPITCSAGRPISAYKAGAYKVRVISNNNNIQADGSSVAVTLSRTTSPAVTEVSYCENAPISLQTGVVGSNLFWYGIKYNGGDYGSYKVGENQAATPPSPTTPGVYTYQVTQSSGGCESDIAELKVTVKPKSSPPGNQTVEYCQGSGTKTLTVNAQNPIWYNSAGASLGTTAPTISTDNATPLTYKVTQNTNGCVSDQSTITVNIRAKPAPPTVNTPADVCQFATSVTLSANGQSLQWYNTDGSPRGDAPTPTGGGTAPQTFFVTQTVNGCTSDKATIVQKFIAAPAKPTVANPNPQACQNEPPVQLAASATGTLNWYDFQSKLLANTPAQPTSVTPAPTPTSSPSQREAAKVNASRSKCSSNPNPRLLAMPPSTFAS
ncbi:hypothetical protein GO730_28355 [Spirosoma sp. HMF3257]|uniref:Ig-like domain-containing protein n=1 Tax=Spirosoma telluris TaxID=2183553 RepID=A0A327NTH9_9BACT|nr:hypothetical protein [Spirosoma telluris]RAI77114.1 hypothetical protein HMF3257_28300 [Spirosoma telluris]